MTDLFDAAPPGNPWAETISDGTVLLHGFALAAAPELLSSLTDIVHAAPFRGMETPGGFAMSVATTSCGEVGWLTDATGYRYSPVDPGSGRRWPAMPGSFARLSENAAKAAGFPGFHPDTCLVNRYAPLARMSLHQDRNERDRGAPIVSVSLGLPAIFLFGGIRRSDPRTRIRLEHGDVLVWGGPDRMRFHGVLPLKSGDHEATGNCRINLTIRKAL